MFTFHTPPAIVAGIGATREIAGHVRPILGDRILLVTDKGLRRLGLVDPILRNLAMNGIAVAIFDDVAPDPPEENALVGVQIAKRHRATGVLALGGGSPMDVAKIIALISRSNEPLSAIYGVNAAKGPRMPLVAVPTTAGTGSEATPIAILTTGTAEKKGVVSPLLLPDMAILDAELTLGLPKAITAATGIDAMVHAIEAYSSGSANNNPISRTLAREALRLLGANIREAATNGGNREARAAMLLGSLLAGQAFANSPVAAVHALAYPIGGHFHVPHGLSNALVLPHVLRFNMPEAGGLYAEIAGDAFPDLAGLPAEKRGEAFVLALEALAQALEVPRRLRDVGIPQEALPVLVRDAMKQTRLLINNPRPLTENDAATIYAAAW
ncbi:iron-containing alcohol dehydrogenase [Rhabdaerophilum calidifontis]|uniref:iron-containing alcohol dehydrogenase n=1 Tax=Rhabdaerophilum calidifontis TaxID=2604328 RepID=UPI00123B56E0|nr:iron-containing alcohol dehydrogenase [Rhabdaerophilum calidifontis]